MNKMWVLLAAMLFSQISHANEAQVSAVKQFVEGFNQKNVQSMQSHTTDDVKWFSISEGAMALETSDKEELGEAMQNYFSGYSNANAKIVNLVNSGDFISTVEQVKWQNEGKWFMQCSLGVYRFKQNKIASVWYYPAHVCDATNAQVN
jgi:hypothetical protein